MSLASLRLVFKMASSQQRQMPKDALVIVSILKELGITDYEPRVINQLLEFTYRYVSNVLEDSKVYSNHAKKKVIDLEDVRLAVQMQQDRNFTNPPSRDILLDIARLKNNTPLPLVKPHCGVRLPPDRYCLNSCNFRLKTAKKQSSVKLTTKAPQLQQLVKRVPTQSTNVTSVPRTQTFSTPKPVIKFTPGGLQGQQKLVVSGGKGGGSGLIEMSTIKMEVEDELHTGLKRKREPDELDPLDIS